MAIVHHGINLFGEVCRMKLFLTLEAQSEVLSALLRQTTRELSFVTDREAHLEDVNNYGTEFRLIAIIPTCVDDGFWNALGWKERKQIWRKKKEADIRLRMDYDRFVQETPENQRLMFIDIIVRSIQVVQEKSKDDFRGNELIADILKALNITQDQLDQLNNS